MKKVLVIHPDDRSTDMLKAVYEGKGYERGQGTWKVRGGMHEDWRSLYKLATICEK